MCHDAAAEPCVLRYIPRARWGLSSTTVGCTMAPARWRPMRELHLRPRAGTARRLFVAFALLVVAFAAASWSILARFREIDDGVVAMRRQEEGVRLALELASAVRDQYAHQAHTIILGNDTHLRLLHRGGAARRRPDRDGCGSSRSASRRAGVRRRHRAGDRRARPDLPGADRPGGAAPGSDRDPGGAPAAQVVVTADPGARRPPGDRLRGRHRRRSRGGVAAAQRQALRWTVFFTLFAPLLAAGGRRLRAPLGGRAGRAAPARARPGSRAATSTRASTIDTPDEFGALARQFNAMTASLQRAPGAARPEREAGGHRPPRGRGRPRDQQPAGGHPRLRPAAPAEGRGRLAEDLQVIEDETLRAKLIVDGLLDLSRPLRDRARAGRPPRARATRWSRGSRETRLLEGVAVHVAGSGEAQVRATRRSSGR